MPAGSSWTMVRGTPERYDGAMGTTSPVLHAPGPESFEVICAGEPRWRAAPGHRGFAASAVSAGLLDVATMLAVTQVRVALATVLEDNSPGRTLLAEIAALGMNVGGVKLAPPVTDLVIVDASGGESCVVSDDAAVPDLEIPGRWSSRVLLLSGLSAVTSRLAACCKAARRARRDGAVVVLDVVGSLRHWAGRDARMIAMVLREADVVRCSYLDLAVIGMDSANVRRAMRPDATLVINGDGGTTVTGALGEVRVEAPRERIACERLAEACTAAICAEFARPQSVAETTAGRWHRVLRHGVPKIAGSLPLTHRPAPRARF
jgi:sugar/nucleoside kinase (ribokinase family)